MFYRGRSVEVALFYLAWYFIVAASASGRTRLLVVVVTCAGFAEDSTKQYTWSRKSDLLSV